MKIRVFRYKDNLRWGWECPACRAAASHRRWRHALADGRAHTDTHRTFGFRAVAA